MNIEVAVACAVILVIVAGLVAVRQRRPGRIGGANEDSTDPAADHYYPPKSDLLDEAPHVRVSMSPVTANGSPRMASPHVIADDPVEEDLFDDVPCVLGSRRPASNGARRGPTIDHYYPVSTDQAP